MSTYIERKVSSNNDDAHEADDGTDFSSSALQLNMQSDPGAVGRHNAGLRFTNITIPQGIRIQHVRFLTQHSTLSNQANCDIHCEDIDDAPDFVANADVTSRVRTSASVPWSIDSIPLGNQIPVPPDLRSLVQEVVDRPLWVPGNAIVLLCIGRNTVGPLMRILAHDFMASVAAQLMIVYGESDDTPLLTNLTEVQRLPDKSVGY